MLKNKKINFCLYFWLVTIIALIDTTNAAAATNATKLLKIVCKYPTADVSCPIASTPIELPTASKAITATRNSVVFFLSMFKKPMIKPKMNRINRTVVAGTAVINAARMATTRPTMNAHFPIMSNSMLYLFLVINIKKKL